ncbi:MAG: hypothetical protein UZ14_CFX002000230 [Chloroflexi bacterium OLB14]|nr:MAG: hypothetical protein UZ14_CFX002000230 [Chloroflexi bacterium OLB14]
MKKHYFALLLFTTILLSCANKDSDKEKNFGEIYSNCEMNTVLKFPKIEFDGVAHIVIIENLSAYEFVFFSRNAEMWRFDNSEWLAVESDSSIFDAGADELYISAYDFRGLPVNPIATAGETIRIAVTGNFIINGIRNEKCIGAFADYV